ncbi:MAG: MarR family transcriptional regulator [Rhodospirillales bacterium]|nr:MarR family transcriptional regulator [Rhodospirillales bacterium]
MSASDSDNLKEQPETPDKGLDEMRQAIELLFFAYRDFTAEPDAILAKYGFGRAHHRIVYFVGRNPGITVSQLLKILQITKQSLARVLRQLVDEGFIEQRLDDEDGRRRLLHLLDKGHDIEIQLTKRQARRIASAFANVGAEAQKGFKDVLRGIINEKDRGRVSADD